MIAPPAMAIAMSFGVKANLRSTYKENSDSNADKLNEEMNMIIKAIKYIGTKIRCHPELSISTTSSSSFHTGSWSISREKPAATNAMAAEKKNGPRYPTPAKNPPMPGPMINPVEIDADINPSALERSSIVVMSAINAVTAGMMNAALIPPRKRDEI